MNRSNVMLLYTTNDRWKQIQRYIPLISKLLNCEIMRTSHDLSLMGIRFETCMFGNIYWGVRKE
jgi:hypothetical protein